MIYVSLKQKLLCKHYSLLNAFFSLHLTMFRPQQTTQYVHSIKMITYLMFYERLILALVTNVEDPNTQNMYHMCSDELKSRESGLNRNSRLSNEVKRDSVEYLKLLSSEIFPST